MRYVLVLIVLTVGSLACAADDAAVAWAWAGAKLPAPAAVQTDLAATWAWASIPPCECGGTSADCPCNTEPEEKPAACTCGCRDGKPCKCPKCPEQLAAYLKLARWALEHPGQQVTVYVRAEPPKGAVNACRYDAGWPDLAGPWKVTGAAVGGRFMEMRRESLAPPVVVPAPVPAAGFNALFSGGACLPGR